MKKTYKDLSPQEETELVLWLSFLEDSVRNAELQLERWKDLKNFWDLHMFFVAVIFVDDAAKRLKSFLSYDDDEVWAILKKFRKEVEGYYLEDLRNEIIHREKIFKLQDKKGNPLPPSPILILGEYIADTDEYIFGTHRIKVSEAFDLLQELVQDIRDLFGKRLKEYSETKDLTGMIPFTRLHMFAAASNVDKTPEDQT